MSDNLETDTCVEQCRILLEAYIKSGRNIDIIKSHPINKIDRYDVLQCVFEKEPEAYRELQIKEFYFMHIKYLPLEEHHSILPMLICTQLINIIEFKKSPLSIRDAIDVFVDISGKSMLVEVLGSAKWSYDTRLKIAKGRLQNIDEWVLVPKKLMDMLEEKIAEKKEMEQDIPKAFIRQCDTCKKITAIDLDPTPEHWKELCLFGETILTVNKTVAVKLWKKSGKCECK